MVEVAVARAPFAQPPDPFPPGALRLRRARGAARARRKVRERQRGRCGTGRETVMNENRRMLVDKVRALLARTTENGCTAAEATAAALAAQKIIVANDITDREINEGRGREEDITEVVSAPFTRSWGVSLTTVIATSLRCRTYFNSTKGKKRKTAVFYGYESDAAAAALLFERLYEVGCRLANEHVREYRRAYPWEYSYDGLSNSFLLGFLRGIKDELERQSRALMVVTPREVNEGYEEIKASLKRWKGTARPSRYYPGAFEDGRTRGRDAVRGGMVEGSLALDA